MTNASETFGMPKHGPPGLTRITTTSDQINDALSKLYILRAAEMVSHVQTPPCHVRVNGRNCTLHIANAYGCHLAETLDMPNESKVFYLLPSDPTALARLDNRVPHLVCDPDENFDRYSTKEATRELQAYLLHTLSKVPA